MIFMGFLMGEREVSTHCCFNSVEGKDAIAKIKWSLPQACCSEKAILVPERKWHVETHFLLFIKVLGFISPGLSESSN